MSGSASNPKADAIAVRKWRSSCAAGVGIGGAECYSRSRCFSMAAWSPGVTAPPNRPTGRLGGGKRLRPVDRGSGRERKTSALIGQNGLVLPDRIRAYEHLRRGNV